jgi:hypothetical protein
MAHTTLPDAQAIADRGEAIYAEKYKKEFERLHHGKFAAIDVETEQASLSETSGGALLEAHRRSPNTFVHLIRVGFPSAF